MEPDDLTIRVLVEIRDEVRNTNQRMDTLTGRVDTLTEHVDRMSDRVGSVEAGLEKLGQRVVESEIRTATAITELHGTMRDIHGLLKNQLDLRDRVERCEREIDELKKRVI